MLTLPLCCIYKFFTKEVGDSRTASREVESQPHPNSLIYNDGAANSPPSPYAEQVQIGSDGYKPENRDILSDFSESRLSPRETAFEAMAGTHWQPLHFS